MGFVVGECGRHDVRNAYLFLYVCTTGNAGRYTAYDVIMISLNQGDNLLDSFPNDVALNVT